jgi:chromate transporter
MNNKSKALISIFKTFLLIGSISFGGYMALIAMVRKKMVEEDKIISDEILLEGISLSSLLPGPVAVNVVAYVGYKLSGIIGAFVSIFAVLLPSFILVTICAILYFNFGSSALFEAILIGIVPVVVAVIVSVGLSMLKKTCIHIYQYLLMALSFLSLFFFSGYWAIVIVILISAGVGIALEHRETKVSSQTKKSISSSLIWTIIVFLALFGISKFYLDFNILAKLFNEFSAISLTLFGGGYVMVPILKSIMVDQLSWLTYEEFVFGISIGQVTPGPILISAAFFGYKMYGILGALVATFSIFLPSSILMIFASEFYQNIKENVILKSALQGVKPAVVGLILYSGVSIFLKHIELYDIWISILIGLVSLIALIRFKIHAIIILIFGGVFGTVSSYFYL